MKLYPVSDYIIIEKPKQEEKTPSGIIIPTTVEREKPQYGKVFAVGPGRLLENGSYAKVQVKVGDMVFFKRKEDDKKSSFAEIKVDGKEYFAVKENEIITIVK